MTLVCYLRGTLWAWSSVLGGGYAGDFCHSPLAKKGTVFLHLAIGEVEGGKGSHECRGGAWGTWMPVDG